jgi:hypothetical protein
MAMIWTRHLTTRSVFGAVLVGWTFWSSAASAQPVTLSDLDASVIEA